MIRVVLLAALVVCMAGGCTSFKSTMIHRDGDHESWSRQPHVKGFPITVSFPTHIRVDVIEKFYLHKPKSDFELLDTPVPIRAVDYEVLRSEKVFFVDLKRPASGEITAAIDLDAETQYFTSIANKVEEQTLQDVAELVRAVAPNLLTGAQTAEKTGKGGKEINASVFEITSTVASYVFDLDEASYEHQVALFLDDHLNCCHTCRIVAPSVKSPTVLPNIDETPVGPTQGTNPPPAPAHQMPAPADTPTTEALEAPEPIFYRRMG